MGLSQEIINWFQGRKISRKTLDKLPVASGMGRFHDGTKVPCAVFRYGLNGSYKARSSSAKEWKTNKGFEASFWNLPAVLSNGTRRVFITEGELDACALVEAGIDSCQVLSVPTGARENPSDDASSQNGYNYVAEALESGLRKMDEFIWAGDSDAPGRALRQDMVAILGAAKFRYIEWGDGCKDANDYLRAEGPENLRDICENGSLPWPVSGLFKPSELPDPPSIVVWSPGFDEWGSKIMFSPKMISLLIGHPGHGKTVLASQIWFNVVKRYQVPICVATFETRPKPHYIRNLRTFYSGRLEKEMDYGDIKTADEWINNYYNFVIHPEQKPNLVWFLDVAETAVIRNGAKIILIDPWNRLEAARNRWETETEYVLKCLRSMAVFAQDMNVHLMIIAHPAKMDAARKGGPPLLEDTSGSKHFENVIDQGLVVHRPDMYDDAIDRKTACVLYQRKTRFEELGYPCKVNLRYDLTKGRYVSTDYDGA